MSLAAIADVALDTSPLSGGTTTLHSLWMGLPIVALDAQCASEGSTARTLEGLGCGQWVAQDDDAYVARALALLDSPEALLEHRRTIRERMQTSDLMCYAERTRDLEQALRLLWINHLLGERRFLDLNTSVEQAVLTLAEQAGRKE
jgi:predicted O-linked N-acetylglucosamine transferase (SPINDLY family)